MTLSSPSDDLGSPPLVDDRAAARSVMQTFWVSQNAHSPRGPVARLFGRSPLSGESRAFFVGALGEIEVAERLRALGTRGESWRVLHSVPVEAGQRDVDHVVIGPAGVFTLLVALQVTSSLGRARPEAERASILLGRALGEPVPVSPVVVVRSSGRGRSVDADSAVVPADRIDRYLRRQKPVYSVDEVREITRAALKPRTWQPRDPKAPQGHDPAENRAGSAAVPTPHELHAWFARVRSEVDAARRVQTLWTGGSVVALIALVVEAPTFIQGLLG